MFSTNPFYQFFRRFECHHTHYQGTAFRLKLAIFTNIMKPWLNKQILYNQTVLLRML